MLNTCKLRYEISHSLLKRAYQVVKVSGLLELAPVRHLIALQPSNGAAASVMDPRITCDPRPLLFATQLAHTKACGISWSCAYLRQSTTGLQGTSASCPIQKLYQVLLFCVAILYSILVLRLLCLVLLFITHTYAYIYIYIHIYIYIYILSSVYSPRLPMSVAKCPLLHLEFH